jgi:hypothetical protein
MTTAVVRRAAEVLPLEPFDDRITTHAVTAVRSIVERVASGDISPRQARRLDQAFHVAGEIAGDIRRIVENGQQMVIGAAAVTREVAKCAAEIDAYATEAAENDAKRAEAAARKDAAPDAVKQEIRVRKLTAEVQAEELEVRLAALKAEKTRAAAPTAPAAPPVAQQRRAITHTPDGNEVILERLHEEASRIVREVQAGSVPTGARHPYHAFAACIYMHAKLDGQPTREAAAHTQRELVSQMLTERDFTLAEISTLGREYQALKKRFEGAADARKNATVLSALSRLGTAPASSNGGGAG